MSEKSGNFYVSIINKKIKQCPVRCIIIKEIKNCVIKFK